MYRHIYRTVSSSEKTLKACISQYAGSLTKSIPILRYLDIGRDVSLPKPVIKPSRSKLPPKMVRSTVLFSGILAFLGLEEEDPLTLLIKKGILAMKRGQFDKSEQFLHQALQLAQSESNEDGITYVYDTLANLALVSGQFEKSEKLFRSVMQRLLASGYETNDNKVIHISLKMAKIYENTHEAKKADLGYVYCIDTLHDKVTNAMDDVEKNVDTLELWITTLDNYARFLANQDRLPEAMEMFQKAYDMCVRVYGQTHENSALLLNDLGTVSNKMGNIDEALHYFEQAAEIGKSLPEMEHLYIIHINLGLHYLFKGMYDKARSACYFGLRQARVEEDEEYIKSGSECLKMIDEAMKGHSL